MERFEKEIRKKLTSLEVEPPIGMWESIESRLPIPSGKRAFYQIRGVAAAIAIFVVSALTYFILQPFLSYDATIVNQQNQISLPSEVAHNGTDTHELFTQNTTQHQLSQSRSEIISKPSDGVINRENPSFRNTNIPIQLIPPLRIARLESSTSQNLLAKHSGRIYTIAESENTNIAPNVELTLGEMFASNIIPSGTINKPRLFMSAYMAPQQSYRYQTAEFVSPLHPLESELLTFNGGLLIGMGVHKRMDLQSGLVFNMIGQRVHDIAFFNHSSLTPLYSTEGQLVYNHPQSMSTSMGGILFTDQSFYFADISSTRIITLKGSHPQNDVTTLQRGGTGLVQQLKYLEAPVIFRYKIIDGNLDFYAKTGITTSYLLSGDVYLKGAYQTAPVGKVVGVSRVNFSSQIGLGLSYPISEKLNLNIEPTASMFIKPVGQIRYLTHETYPYSWSVMFSLSYKL